MRQHHGWDSITSKERWQWIKLRRRYIRANPLCVLCDSEGKVEPATVIDHIQPLQHEGALLDVANLQALCTACHSEKSRLEGRRGKAVVAHEIEAYQQLASEDWGDDPRITQALNRLTRRASRLARTT